MKQLLIKPIWKGQITIPGTWRKDLWITNDTYVRVTLMEKWVFIQNANINLDEIDDEKIFDEAVKSDEIKTKLSLLASQL